LDIEMTQEIFQQLRASLSVDLLAFLPELILCFTIVLLLVLRLFNWFNRNHMGWWAFWLTLLALIVSWQQWTGTNYDPRIPIDASGKPDIAASVLSLDLFSGLLVYDNFTIFIRLFLFSFTALVLLLCMITGIPDREDSADFCCLLLGATVGMSLMASSNHLLMVFLGVEMASLPSYAMAGFLKGRRQSSEAALKYVVYGGGAAGIMLYGISLLAGRFGTAYLPDLTQFMAASFVDGTIDPIVLLGGLFVLIGIAFKIAAVPFHFWCPDVFEGAAAEVAAFLSVASKGAALALLARIAFGLAGISSVNPNYEAWAQVAPYLAPVLAFFAVVTMTFGNLAAYGQTNLKRLLAYSTIAHAGFMMMGVATLTREGAGAVLFYLIVYLIMNLGAFAVVAFIRNVTGSEDLNDFRGLIRRAPVMVVTLGFFLLSLLGLPPLAGFVAKFQIFSVLYNAGRQYTDLGHAELGYTMYAMLVIGGLNSVISLFYYVKVLRVMVIEKSVDEVEGKNPEPLVIPWLPRLYVSALAALLLFLGIFWNTLSEASVIKGVDRFHAAPTVEEARVAKGVQP